MRPPATLVAGLALCLAVAACARRGDDATPDVGVDGTESVEATTGVGDVTATTTPAPTATTTPAPTATGDVGAGADTPEPSAPDATPTQASALAGQFTAFVGGVGDGESCPDDVDAAPFVGRSPWLDQRAAAGESFLLCLGGFDPAEPVALRLEAAGAAHDVTVSPAGDAPAAPEVFDLWTAGGSLPSSSFATDAWRSLYWWLAPGTPTGVVRVRATQGSVAATGTLEVVVGDVPRFVRSDTGTGGIEFHASGFSPGRHAVGLYRPASPRSGLDTGDQVQVTLVRELDPLVADDSGAGVVVVDPASLGAGEWCVTTSATSSQCRWVVVD